MLTRIGYSTWALVTLGAMAMISPWPDLFVAGAALWGIGVGIQLTLGGVFLFAVLRVRIFASPVSSASGNRRARIITIPRTIWAIFNLMAASGGLIFLGTKLAFFPIIVKHLVTRRDIEQLLNVLVLNPLRSFRTSSVRKDISVRHIKCSQEFRDNHPLGRLFPAGFDVLEIRIDVRTEEFYGKVIDIAGGAQARITNADLSNLSEMLRNIILQQPVDSGVIEHFRGDPIVILALRWFRFKHLIDQEFQEFKRSFQNRYDRECLDADFVTAIRFWNTVSDNLSNGSPRPLMYLSLRDLWESFNLEFPRSN